MVEGLWAITNDVRPLSSLWSPACSAISVSVSMLGVASSSNRKLGSACSALAKEMSCLYPTESLDPLSLTSV